ncbi:group II intron maturase-specific domain-containing protein [Sinomicrobium sp. M5D2P9]
MGTVRKHRSVKQEELIRILNPIIRGWCNYYQYVISGHTFEKVNNTYFGIIWSWARYRHNNRHRKWIKRKYFTKKGGNNWCFKLKQGIKLVQHIDWKINPRE